VSDDLLNRAGHAAWRAGMLDLTVGKGGTIPPPSKLPFDIGMLETFVWQFKGKLPSSDPIELVLAPSLPPVFAPATPPDAIEVGLGQLMLEIWDVPPSGTRTLVLRIAVHVRAKTQIDVANSHVVLRMSGSPSVEASVVDSPLVNDLDPLGVSNFVQFAVPPILETIVNEWSGLPLPISATLQPQKTDVGSDPADSNILAIEGDY
jgi:hypothetical protein